LALLQASRHLPLRPFIQRVLVLRTPLAVWTQCWLGLLASLGRWTTLAAFNRESFSTAAPVSLLAF
jgi:hypothetical protein